MYTVDKALDILTSTSPKIVSDKQYWLDNYNKLKNTDSLIIQMANYIKPYKEETVTPTPQPIKNITYSETKNGTRQIFLPPEKLNIDIFDKPIANNSFTKYKYAISSTLYGGSVFSVTPLMVNGDYMSKCRWSSNHGKAQGCIIINKDNTVWMTKLNNIADLGNKLYSAKHIIGGISLINNDDPNFKYDPVSEGYSNSVELAGLERTCNKAVLAYIKKSNQLVLMTRPNIHHRNGYSLIQLCKDCGYDYAISLDGSKSVITIADGQYKLLGDNRRVYSILYAE